ncbi:ArgS-related anticodon-binding protein NrtL [Streptomyces sp. NPDC048483]|uniref:ArgS-related anticodon-binding protein NrtL n=1 Tax=Streptomyces sp. NPDC048483 TaxID=3154927 RepID=UPI00341C8A16
MTPADLSRTVLRSVRGAVDEKELSVPVPARIAVRPSRRAGCGDYASNVALQLAKEAGRPAREIAEILRRRLVGSAGIARVEIAGPGFLNFTLGDGAQAALVRDVLAGGDRYGARAPGEALADGQLPGGARGLVVAQALGRMTAAAGAGRLQRSVPASAADEKELAGIVARLGDDEARWALLRPAARDAVRLPERPVQREENPRFRVQYAHARTRALVRNAGDLGFVSEPGEVVTPAADGAGPASRAPAAQTSATHDLVGLLATYPAAVEAAVRHRAPDRTVRHMEATADTFLRWHDACPPLPVGERKPSAVHRARLALAEATGTVLANGLRLLGISAPEHL